MPDRDAATHPPVCSAYQYKRGCMCDKCRAHDASLRREEREQRIKEGLAHGQ